MNDKKLEANLIKQYFSLAELVEEWDLSIENILYLIENNSLVPCFWLDKATVQYGRFEDDFEIPVKVEELTGFVYLIEEDRSVSLRSNSKRIKYIKPLEGFNFAKIMEPKQIEVKLSDLFITRESKKNFENSDLLELRNDRTKESTSIIVKNDYQDVTFKGINFQFGEIQAKVIRLLHEASKTDNPWLYGKPTLYESGSMTEKMASLFQSQRNWREIIASNGKGKYKLNV